MVRRQDRLLQRAPPWPTDLLQRRRHRDDVDRMRHRLCCDRCEHRAGGDKHAGGHRRPPSAPLAHVDLPPWLWSGSVSSQDVSPAIARRPPPRWSTGNVPRVASDDTVQGRPTGMLETSRDRWICCAVGTRCCGSRARVMFRGAPGGSVGASTCTSRSHSAGSILRRVRPRGSSDGSAPSGGQSGVRGLAGTARGAAATPGRGGRVSPVVAPPVFAPLRCDWHTRVTARQSQPGRGVLLGRSGEIGAVSQRLTRSRRRMPGRAGRGRGWDRQDTGPRRGGFRSGPVRCGSRSRRGLDSTRPFGSLLDALDCRRSSADPREPRSLV